MFWKMTHPTTAGYSLKSMMWGTDGTERRGCGERCSEVFQHGNKDFDCLSMNNSSLLIAAYDKETVLGPVQNVSGQMEAKRNSKQTGNFCSPPPKEKGIPSYENHIGLSVTEIGLSISISS